MEYDNFINSTKIEDVLRSTEQASAATIHSILDKALEMKGLEPEEIALLLNITDADMLEELFRTALKVKQEIYGNRLVLFAPLYVSNLCSNNCLYCGFRADNKDIVRRSLTIDEIKEETRIILEQGHKRILMLMGENHSGYKFDEFLEAIQAVYSVRDSKGSYIRRINVEVAPLTEEEFHKLGKANIGTYTVFQETYHPDT